MKIEFEIIQKIKVKPIGEAEIKKILIAAIQKEIPEATINGVEFITKRNPTRIELEVDAQYGDAAPAPEINDKVKVVQEPKKAEEQLELAPEVLVSGKITDDKDELIESILPDKAEAEPVKAEKVPAALTGDVAAMFQV